MTRTLAFLRPLGQNGAMAVRWYSVVIDCVDVARQGVWWSETLGWPIVYQAADEVVVAPGDDPESATGPGLVFVPVPEGKTAKNRLHIDLAPASDDDQAAEVARLVARGAKLTDVGQGVDVSWVVLQDPEGNEFCVLSPRD
jgi:predicted enzyme related to lactoylglutathione lyase